MQHINKFLVIVLFNIVVTAVQAANPAVIRIQNYLEATFPDKQLVLDTPMLEQLAWVESSPYHTSEMDPKAAQLTVHREVPRALSRIFCLRQLRSGLPENYLAFVKPQPEASRLTQESFNHLSALIRKLDDAEYTALETSVILSSVTLSQPAKEQTALALPNKSYPVDTVQFLAFTAPHANTIYPLARAHTKTHPQTEKLLTVLFQPDSHFRHMLYVEGGVGMYKNISRQIQNKQLTAAGLNLWYAGWVANITGFRGHIAPNGSLYLDEHTFQSMQRLKAGLDRMLQEPGYAPLADYLAWRAERLGFNGRLDNGISEFGLAWLSAILRIHQAKDASQLVTAWHQLPEPTRKKLAEHVSRLLTQPDLPTPTYGPAVFANALAITEGNMGATLKATLPVYFSALEQAEQHKQAGKMAQDIPVNFNAVADTKILQQLLQKSDSTPQVHVDKSSGIVLLNSI